jgi:CDGSH-type Zn-finger protein
VFSCSRARRPSPAHSQARAVVSVRLAVVCYSRSHHTHHLAPTHRRLCLCRCGANKPRPSADTERVGWLDDGCGAAGGGRAAGGFAAYLGSASLVFGTTCTFLGTAVTFRGNANTGTGSRAHARAHAPTCNDRRRRSQAWRRESERQQATRNMSTCKHS